MATEGKKLIQSTVRAYHLSPGWVLEFGIRREKKKEKWKTYHNLPLYGKTAAVGVWMRRDGNIDEASVLAHLCGSSVQRTHLCFIPDVVAPPAALEKYKKKTLLSLVLGGSNFINGK